MAIPIRLIVDDPAPLLNVYWWHAADAQGTDEPRLSTGEPVARETPLDFMRQFAHTVGRRGIRGKFGVLTYPAGLGSIAEGWPGRDAGELAEWIEIARSEVMPLMDITPEIPTHARAVDLDTMELRPEDEQQWAPHETAATMGPYIAAAL